MNYKVYIYAFMVLVSVFALSGINFNELFKKNKYFEARVFVVLLILSLSYLASQFIICFIEAS